MTAFHVTLDALYYFCVQFVLRLLGRITWNAVEHHKEIREASPVVHDVVHTTPTFKTVQEILRTDISSFTDTTKNMVMYAGNISVPVYKNPTIEFDTQVTKISYGEMVMMVEVKGRFCKIVWKEVEGWVLRDDVVDRAVRVYPKFVVGQENGVDAENTARVRSLIGDPFGLGYSEFNLQAGEYILYRLWKRSFNITWPETRPRVPGLWHKILRGVPRIHIGVIPKVGGIMEYVDANEIGHLSYIETVFPDDTIVLSEVNYPDSGIYNERELSKAEWKELRPVFIVVQP